MKKQPIYLFQISVRNLEYLTKMGYKVILRGWGEVKYEPSRLSF